MPESMTQHFTALGNRVTEGDLEPIILLPHVSSVTMESDEVTALCPVTSQPDYYRVSINFGPDGRGIESKSLKLYLQRFRNMGIFAENLSAQVLVDVMYTIKPKWCNVTVVQKSRGGVTITALATDGAGATMGAVQGES